MKKGIQGYWDFFELTFKVGDTFKHTLKSVEKYVNKNYKPRLKLTWEPKVIIQIIKGNRTVRLEENFNDFTRYQGTELLLIQLYHGATLLKVIGLYIDYLRDEQHWIVRSMSNDPLAAWRGYS